MCVNGLQLQEVGDFGDENCLSALNLIRSTKLYLTTEPPISCRCCYGLVFFYRSLVAKFFGLKIIIVKMPQTVIKNPI